MRDDHVRGAGLAGRHRQDQRAVLVDHIEVRRVDETSPDLDGHPLDEAATTDQHLVAPEEGSIARRETGQRQLVAADASVWKPDIGVALRS